MPAPILAKLPDGRRIALYCQGVGTPIVILDSGLGMGASVWRRVQPELARKTRTCSYDRAGYGLSDPGPLPRDAQHIVADLDAALHAANLAGPDILVGHSMGGFDMRLYANLHRASVAGMVLVDPSIDGDDKPLIAASAAWARQTAADDQAAMTCIRAAAASRIPRRRGRRASSCPPPPASVQARPEMAQAVLSERENLAASSDEVAATQIRYGALPLIVLTAGAQFGRETGLPLADREVLFAVWRNGHKRIAQLSDIGVERVVEGASHLIQIADPGAVVEAVDEVMKLRQ
jgi:pimeloyl-ACP methyl ester carboxylesterase